ncbi:MAG: glycosyltransferase family 8 protein [Lentisphaerae bacterium]|nr:glycosyltransferase family 8 protein [Lentisphaerota bacterium]
MKLTVVYASDVNYAKLTAISAVSLLKHNPGARVVLLGYNLEKETQDIVRSRVESHGGEFLYLDVSGEIEKLKDRGYCGYTSYAAYARIFIPDLLHEEGKVIYLDGDTLVNGSISEMLDIQMDGKPVAFGTDCTPVSYKLFIKVTKNQPYYNSGVMVIDLVQWRKRHCTERFLDELEHPHGPLVLPDQDVFVRSIHEEIAPLGPKWNFIPHYYLFSYEGVRRVVGGEKCILFSKQDYMEAQRDPRIFHFLGHTLGRPWYTSSKHPMREAYRQAAAEAGFPEFAEQTRPMSFDYKVQYWLHKLLPQFMFDIACNVLYRINIWKNYHV